MSVLISNHIMLQLQAFSGNYEHLPLWRCMTLNRGHKLDSIAITHTVALLKMGQNLMMMQWGLLAQVVLHCQDGEVWAIATDRIMSLEGEKVVEGVAPSEHRFCSRGHSTSVVDCGLLGPGTGCVAKCPGLDLLVHSYGQSQNVFICHIGSRT